MKTQRVAHLLCHLLVLFPAASFAPSRGPRPSTCLRKKGGVEFEDFSSVGTVPAAARELSGALAEEQRDMAVISPLVNDLSQWANVPPGTRESTYSEEYMAAAPFAKITLESLKQADPASPSAKPVPFPSTVPFAVYMLPCPVSSNNFYRTTLVQTVF